MVSKIDIFKWKKEKKMQPFLWSIFNFGQKTRFLGPPQSRNSINWLTLGSITCKATMIFLTTVSWNFKTGPTLSDVSIFNLSLISPHLYNVIISSLGRDKRETIKSKDLLNNRIGLKVGIYWMVYRVFHSKVVNLVSALY